MKNKQANREDHYGKVYKMASSIYLYIYAHLGEAVFLFLLKERESENPLDIVARIARALVKKESRRRRGGGRRRRRLFGIDVYVAARMCTWLRRRKKKKNRTFRCSSIQVFSTIAYIYSTRDEISYQLAKARRRRGWVYWRERVRETLDSRLISRHENFWVLAQVLSFKRTRERESALYYAMCIWLEKRVFVE